MTTTADDGREQANFYRLLTYNNLSPTAHLCVQVGLDDRVECMIWPKKRALSATTVRAKRADEVGGDGGQVAIPASLAGQGIARRSLVAMMPLLPPRPRNGGEGRGEGVSQHDGRQWQCAFLVATPLTPALSPLRGARGSKQCDRPPCGAG